MKFEEKINELEKIVDELENDNTDLDKSINEYTKAMKLVKECDEELKKFEKKVVKMVDENNNEKDFDISE